MKTLNREEITNTLLQNFQDLKNRKDISLVEIMKPLQTLNNYQYIWVHEELNKTKDDNI